VIADKRPNLIFITSNPKRFAYDYEHSRFIECNTVSAQITMKKYPQDWNKNRNILPSMIYIRNMIEGFYKKYWLMSGTLLGIFISTLLNIDKYN